MNTLTGFLLFSGIAYTLDVLIEPQAQAYHAREEAKRRRKPVLNIGAGLPDTSLRAFLFGSTLWGDVNLDIGSNIRLPKRIRDIDPEVVYYGDINKIPFPNKFFGSVIASHVVEHVEDPNRAIRECKRVAHKTFIITPKWWCPHTWLHPGHRYYRTEHGNFLLIE